MTIFTETERLLLREITFQDEQGMFELDSDPEVHKYLGNKPVATVEESRKIIGNIRNQYLTNGIGRWAIVLKETNTFIGWGGLKLVTEPVNNQVNFYDLGYRFIKQFWGKGYGAEVAAASRDYGLNVMKLPEINAYAEAGNAASRRILEKTGFSFTEYFEDAGDVCAWYALKNSRV